MLYGSIIVFIFFFSSRRRHTRYWRDWSSDVCSSDLGAFSRAWLDGLVDADVSFLARLEGYGAVASLVAQFVVPFDGEIQGVARSEERRVGKECRSRWSPYH